MTGEITQCYPWEPAPVERTVALLQRDFAYAIIYTCVRVRSNRPELETQANTPRGQLVPQGVARFTGGATIEFHDIGMPQIGTPELSVKDLMALVLEIARSLGLELET